MLYTERPPHPALVRHIRCLWVFEACPADSASNIQTVVPDGCPEMVLHYGDGRHEIGTGGILGDKRVVFENLAHDFPHRIIYSAPSPARGEGKNWATWVSLLYARAPRTNLITPHRLNIHATRCVQPFGFWRSTGPGNRRRPARIGLRPIGEAVLQLQRIV